MQLGAAQTLAGSEKLAIIPTCAHPKSIIRAFNSVFDSIFDCTRSSTSESRVSEYTLNQEEKRLFFQLFSRCSDDNGRKA